MNRRNTLTVFAASLLAFGSLQTAFAGDCTTGTTAISAEQDSADFIARVREALSHYVAACAIHDLPAMSDYLTSFAAIEYSTADAGRFTALDAHAADTCWEGPSVSRGRSSDSPFVIYLTSELHALLVQYPLTVGSGNGARSIQDLALVEIDGNRIARIRDYAAPIPDR